MGTARNSRSWGNLGRRSHKCKRTTKQKKSNWGDKITAEILRRNTEWITPMITDIPHAGQYSKMTNEWLEGLATFVRKKRPAKSGQLQTNRLTKYDMRYMGMRLWKPTYATTHPPNRRCRKPNTNQIDRRLTYYR